MDLLGFDDAGCSPSLTTTADVTAPVAGDTWSEDCTGGVAGTGTPWNSKFLNRLLQQLRVSIRKSSVPLSNSYDAMLSWAMQSGAANWAGVAGGTANALTGTAPNAPLAVQVGTLVRLKASAPNTGAATFDWAGLGAEPIVLIDGTALTGGEIQNNQRLLLMWDGAAWILMTPAIGWIVNRVPPQNPFILDGIGAAVILAPNDPSNMVAPPLGTTFSFLAAGPLFAWGYGSTTFYGQDSRWSPAPGGTWQVTQIAFQTTMGGVALNGSSLLALRIA